MDRYSPRTEAAYIDWIKRFIRFHGVRHPQEMGADEVKAFLGHLATEMNVAASTQNQAFSALLFLYQEVLKLRLPWIEDIVRILADRRAKEFYAWHSCRNFEFDSDTVKIGGHDRDFTRCRETEQPETTRSGCRPVRWARIPALALPETPVAL